MEAPNPKHQISNKSQFSKFKIPFPSPLRGEGRGEGLFDHLRLEFVIWDFGRYALCSMLYAVISAALGLARGGR